MTQSPAIRAQSEHPALAGCFVFKAIAVLSKAFLWCFVVYHAHEPAV